MHVVHVVHYTLCEKCPYSNFPGPYSVPNAGKYGPEKLRIQTLHAVILFLNLFKKLIFVLIHNLNFLYVVIVKYE